MRNWRLTLRGLCGGLLLAAAVSPAGVFANGLLEKRESLYNNIFIFGDTDSVTMTFGQNKRYYTESVLKRSDPGALTVDYTRFMTLGIAYSQKLERILEIGLGGGRTVSYLSAAMPDTGIVAVELDKDVLDLAKKYFLFKETARLRAVVGDESQKLQARLQKQVRDDNALALKKMQAQGIQVVPTPTPLLLPCRLDDDSTICRLVDIWLGPAAMRTSTTAAPGVQLA